MEHFYQEIDGWFDYEEIYRQVLERLPDNARIVELGCWRGKSSAYLAVEAYNLSKGFDLHFVDTWGGSPEHLENQKLLKELQEDAIYKEFRQNLSRVDIPCHIHRMTSLEAADLFLDNSIDFIFFDTDHSFTYVTKELNAWYPKVKMNGILAGHDYKTSHNVGVALAVNQFFKQDIQIYPGQIALSWITKKPDNLKKPPVFKIKLV